MLVRTRRVTALPLACLFLLTAAAAAAAPGADAKRMAAKALDVDGYRPSVFKAAGAILDESEPNDTPATADPIAVGDMVRGGLAASADEDWFSVSGASGWVAVSTAPDAGSITDTVLEVFAADGVTSLASDDDAGVGLFSAVRHVAVPAGGDLLIRVTRFAPVGDSSYVLSVEVDTAPPPAPSNDRVETAEFVETCSSILLGDTSTATNALSGACVAYDPLGPDVFYRLELPYSFQLTLVLQLQGPWDASLYLFTDPADPAGSCLAGADLGYAGEAEQLIYVNEDEAADPLVLYLAVDSWDPSQFGSFLLETRCEFVVPVETASWGSLKARF